MGPAGPSHVVNSAKIIRTNVLVCLVFFYRFFFVLFTFAATLYSLGAKPYPLNLATCTSDSK